jgi:hypothetical protein
MAKVPAVETTDSLNENRPIEEAGRLEISVVLRESLGPYAFTVLSNIADEELDRSACDDDPNRSRPFRYFRNWVDLYCGAGRDVR